MILDLDGIFFGHFDVWNFPFFSELLGDLRALKSLKLLTSENLVSFSETQFLDDSETVEYMGESFDLQVFSYLNTVRQNWNQLAKGQISKDNIL